MPSGEAALVQRKQEQRREDEKSRTNVHAHKLVLAAQINALRCLRRIKQITRLLNIQSALIVVVCYLL